MGFPGQGKSLGVFFLMEQSIEFPGKLPAGITALEEQIPVDGDGHHC